MWVRRPKNFRPGEDLLDPEGELMTQLRRRPVTEREQAIIGRLLSLEPDSLYTEIGQELGTLAPGQDPETAARGWFAQRKDEIHLVICVRGQYCAFIAANRNAQMVEIIACLSDLLATVAGGLPVYTLATLIFKSSLDSFCECESHD
jgi:hypothetical protein